MQGEKNTVLLIESDPSLRRLIALGLQHLGMCVIEAASPLHMPEFDGRQIDLLVLDLEGSAQRRHTSLVAAHALLSHPLLSTLPTILLVWEYPSVASNASGSVTGLAPVRYLTKPFDARIFYEMVGHLLSAKKVEEATYDARAEELLLASYSRHTSPSLWPIVTAAGLLLAFIGMMLQVAVTVVGIIIIMVALLLWTLDRKPNTNVALAHV